MTHRTEADDLLLDLTAAEPRFDLAVTTTPPGGRLIDRLRCAELVRYRAALTAIASCGHPAAARIATDALEGKS